MTRTWTPTGAGLEARFKDNGKRLKLPPTSEIAAALREGEVTYEQVTEDFNLKPSSLMRLLNLAGWSQDGHPVPSYAPPKRTPIVPFLSDDQAWMDSALCAQADPEDFFPEYGRITAADQICHDCPVAKECLKSALREEEGLPLNYRHGIRGATTPAQRFEMARAAS